MEIMEAVAGSRHDYKKGVGLLPARMANGVNAASSQSTRWICIVLAMRCPEGREACTELGIMDQLLTSLLQYHVKESHEVD